MNQNKKEIDEGRICQVPVRVMARARTEQDGKGFLKNPQSPYMLAEYQNEIRSAQRLFLPVWRSCL